jgi:hypothetical protein
MILEQEIMYDKMLALSKQKMVPKQLSCLPLCDISERKLTWASQCMCSSCQIVRPYAKVECYCLTKVTILKIW